MKKWISLLLCTAMLCGVFSACGAAQTDSVTDPEKIQATGTTGQNSVQVAFQLGVQNLTEDLVPNTVQAQPVDGAAVTEFALDMLRQSAEQENVVLSPLSAYLALALAANGAAGETLAEFEQLLGNRQADVNKLVYGFCDRLTQNSGSTKVRLANAAWIQNNFPVSEVFLQKAVDYFDADIFAADLPTQEAMDAVNAWVNEETNGEIDQLLEQTPDANTAMLLLNALYFEGQWEHPFQKSKTQMQSFITSDEQTVSCEFMRDETTRPYISGEGFDGVVLPYDCGQYAMIVIRPTQGQSLEELIQTLDAEQLSQVLDGVTEQEILLQIPRFSFEATTQMEQMLQNMGLTNAFSDTAADFSALTSDDAQLLYMSQVLQKVKIDVMEDGTRAAAATEVEVMSRGISKAQQICFDHPFIYAIIDLQTRTPLFMGTVTNPAQ